MTAGYRLSKAAKKDLADIYRYTREKFGKAQSETYLAGLRLALDVVAEYPLIGPEQTEFNPSIRMHPHEQHVILYVADAELPLIVRIVAGRQRWQLLL